MGLLIGLYWVLLKQPVLQLQTDQRESDHLKISISELTQQHANFNQLFLHKMQQMPLSLALGHLIALTKKCGLTMISLKPDVSTQTMGLSLQSVDLQMKGSFFALMKFLQDISALPFLLPMTQLDLTRDNASSHTKNLLLNVKLALVTI
ncbi:MAG: type 4a pilus biogenesis protein PilO [Gammaproteobacteria bacterium]